MLVAPFEALAEGRSSRQSAPSEGTNRHDHPDHYPYPRPDLHPGRAGHHGFGPGAPAGKAVHVSWHGAGHLIAASIGFTALIVACFVVARYFSRERHRGPAVFSRVTGLAFLAAFAGVITGSSASAVVVPFYAAVLLAWIWIAVTSVHLYRRTDAPAEAGGR